MRSVPWGLLIFPETWGYTAKRYVRLNEVQKNVGERISEMLECEAADVPPEELLYKYINRDF